MDALEFSKENLAELSQRLSHATYPEDEGNFGLSKEAIAQKFLDDQGIAFENVDIPAILALT